MRSETEIADKLKEVQAAVNEMRNEEPSEEKSQLITHWVCLRWIMGEDV